ncbi:MAG: hypothetical protein ACKN82_01695 [Pirellula sp.]
MPDNKPFGNGENKGPPWQPLYFWVNWKSRSDLDATPERSAADAGLTKTMKVKFDPKNPAIAHDITMEETTDVETIFPDRCRTEGKWYFVDFKISRSSAGQERIPR